MVQDIKNEYKKFLDTNDNNEVSPSILWDSAKVVLRGKIIALSSKLKKEREKDQELLEEQIKKLESEHKRTNYNTIFMELSKCRQKLSDLLTSKAEGALRFTNQKYYEQGNKASRLPTFQLRKAQAS